jgi:hypothetical protein
MSDAPLLLGFDTSLPHCAAALLRGAEVLEAVCVEMGRGQAEELMPMLEDLLARHGAGWRDLSRIGVGVGPGNFTGIRISVSAARGLALGLDVPVLGVSTFDALRGGTEGRAAVPAPREMAYVQDGTAEPCLVPRGEVPLDALWPEDGAALAIGIARLAAMRTPGAPPAPLYLRPADAAPPRDAPPVILD